MEAALVTGLVAVGLPQHTAVPTVFFYRLVTFWLPVVPGWFALNWLKRADFV
jgi:glycosyltransferase 2 family protein